MKNIRQPAVAGTFYPASPEKLKKEIKSLLDSVELDENVSNIFGIISPHAGYVYSGKTAAYAYKCLSGKKIKTVIIISPSHREYFRGISIFDGDAYRTPLGDVLINKEIVENLTNKKTNIFKGNIGHGTEHALEVQIPFLQCVLEKFTIVPVVIGDQSKMFVDCLAERIAEVFDDEMLVVVSSDLSHFHSGEKADLLDSIIEQRIINFEYEQLLEDLAFEKCEACGGGPIVSLMKAADLRNIKKSKILSRTNSGDVTGDYSEVVGYLSAVIYA